MKRYTAIRRDDGRVAAYVDGQPLKHQSYHSPDGFEMGYHGSGPADLAFSILADYFGEPNAAQEIRSLTRTDPSLAWKHHQAFKSEFIARHQNRLDVSSDEISVWLETRPW